MLIYTLNKYANKEGWSGDMQFTGYTLVKKMNPLTNSEIQFRADSRFQGYAWCDWGLFTFDDANRSPNTLNAGMILGFVKFQDIHFPTTRRRDGHPRVSGSLRDTTLYVVARCSPEYHNFDKKLVTEITLGEGIYLIPIKDLLGPACIVPNIFTEERMVQDKESWLFVMPRRKWGRRFGDSIEWTK